MLSRVIVVSPVVVLYCPHPYLLVTPARNPSSGRKRGKKSPCARTRKNGPTGAGIKNGVSVGVESCKGVQAAEWRYMAIPWRYGGRGARGTGGMGASRPLRGRSPKGLRPQSWIAPLRSAYRAISTSYPRSGFFAVRHYVSCFTARSRKAQAVILLLFSTARHLGIALHKIHHSGNKFLRLCRCTVCQLHRVCNACVSPTNVSLRALWARCAPRGLINAYAG